MKKLLTVSRPELLVDGSDLEFRRFLHNFMALSSRLIGIRTRLAEFAGLHTAAYSIIVALAFLTREDDEEVGVNQVAYCLYVSASFVTTEVNKLVKAGLVEKRIDFKDRRRVLLTITEKGKQLLAQLSTVRTQLNDQMFASLTATDFRKLRSLLGDLIDCADRAHLTMDFLSHSAGEKSDVSPRRKKFSRRSPQS